MAEPQIIGDIAFSEILDGTQEETFIVNAILEPTCDADFCEDFSEYAFQKLPTFRDNFNYPTQVSADANWDLEGTRVRANATTEVTDIDCTKEGVLHQTAFDLGAGVSNEKWVLRFDCEILTTSVPTTNDFSILVNVSDSDETVGVLSAQDTITWEHNVQGGTGLDRMLLRWSDGVGILPGTGNNFFVTTGAPTAGSGKFYIEIKRLSATTCIINHYSDASFTTLVDTTGVQIIPSAIRNLRYIRVSTRDDVTSAGAQTAQIDKVEFWNGGQQGDVTFQDDFKQKTVTFEDDFSGTDDWDDTGTRNAVNITTDVIDWDAVRDSTNQSTSFDLGVAGVNDEKWAFRFKVVVDAVSTPSVNNQSIYFAVDSVDHSVNADSASHDVCLLRGIRFSGGASEWGLHSANNGTYGGTESDFTHTLVAETLYIEMKRTSATQFECSFFSDATFTTLIERITSTIPANVTNLRYLVVKNWNGDTSTGGSLDGTMDDVEFWNGTSTLTRWLGAIGNDVGLDIVNKRVNFDPPTGVDRDELVAFDLQTILDGSNADDENWTLRFKINTDTLVQGSSEESASLFVGLDNNLDSTISATHNLILFRTTIDQGGAGPQFGAISSSLSRLGGGYTSGTGTATQFPIAWSTGTRYVEVKRLSSTETLTTLYTDASFTDIEKNSSGVPLSVQDTIDSGIINLRYIRVTTDSSAVANDTSYDGSIDDIEFYNGVSVSKTPLLEAKDFEDTLFTSSNWSQTGTGIAVNTGTQVIDWTSILDNTNKAIIHDLGATISNTEWTLRFKWTFDSEVVPIAPNQGKYLWIGLFSADGASDSNTVQDAITFFHSKSVNNNIVSIGERNNVILTNAGTDHEFSNAVDMVVGDIRYVELKRISSTIAECALYSDRDYSILVERIRVTIASGIVNLRYLGIKGRNTAQSGVGSQTGTIDDIEFWDKVSGKTHKKVWREVDE